MKKNLKIAITPEQPLDDVVVELERLGYRKYNDLMLKKPIVVEAYADGIYCLYSEDLHVCKETTLTELKEMEWEMKSFDEYKKFLCETNTVDSFDSFTAFKAGQQSKQAEVDELRKRIDGIVGIITEAYKSGENSSVENVYDKIQGLLK